MYKMPIFTAEDEDALQLARQENSAYNRELFFAYFEHLAVEAVAEIIRAQKAHIMTRFKAGDKEYELLRFFTYAATTPASHFYRRLLQEDEKSSSAPGCYFTSLSGIHIADLRAIYVHSQFRARIQEELGTDMMTLKMRSRKENDVLGITRYENRLIIKCT
jgi:hypothetical protein